MEIQTKMFESLVERFGVKDMKLGEEAYVVADALVVDPAGDGWINPYAELIRDPRSDQGPMVGIERVDAGFRAGLQMAKMRSHKWQTQARPSAAPGALEWIPVIEFVLGYEPQTMRGLVPRREP